MKSKTQEIAPGITVNPEVCAGQPVLKNTRIPAKYLGELVYHHGIDEALRTYPHLSEKEIRRAHAFYRKNPYCHVQIPV